MTKKGAQDDSVGAQDDRAETTACRMPPLPSFAVRMPPVSLRLGHAAGLTAHRAVIQYRVAASLPQGEGLRGAASFCTAPWHLAMFSERAVEGRRVWFGAPGYRLAPQRCFEANRASGS